MDRTRCREVFPMIEATFRRSITGFNTIDVSNLKRKLSRVRVTAIFLPSVFLAGSDCAGLHQYGDRPPFKHSDLRLRIFHHQHFNLTTDESRGGVVGSSNS
jgi:hypothetical protein